MFLTVWLISAHAAPPIDLQQAASSEWQAAVPQAQMQAIVDAAVADAAKHFPALMRSIARSKLSESAFFCMGVRTEATAERWTSGCIDDGKSFSRDWSREPQPYTSDEGNQVQTSLSHSGTSVTLVFDAGSGSRTTQYSFSGDRMTLVVTVAGDQLKAPMTWTLDYRRSRGLENADIR